jgi:signal peptidase I
VDWLGEMRGLVWMLLAVLAFPQLHRQAVLYPVDLDDAQPAGWRPAGGEQVSLWLELVLGFVPRAAARRLAAAAGATPEYGDIVIVVPKNRTEDLIKRVVALPGDRIAVVNGQIILNGKPVPQAVETRLQIPADPELTCSDRSAEYHCYNDFAGYRTRLPSGRDVLDLPALRETMPNGASYLIIIDGMDQRVDEFPEMTVPAGHLSS